MATFILTGAATDYNGQRVLREQLIPLIQQAGDHYRGDLCADSKDILVASRFDTQKAQVAQQRGMSVWSYTKLYNYLEGRLDGPLTLPAPTARPGWVDYNPRVPVNQRVPKSSKAKTKKRKTAAERAQEVWHIPMEEPPIPDSIYDQSVRAILL